MVIVLFIIFFVSTAVASLYKLKYGFFLFFFSYFAYPEILALGIGSEGFALSMPRALLLLFSLVVLLRIMLIEEDQKYLWSLLSKQLFFLVIGTALYIWKALCTFLKAGVGSTTISGLANDFLIYFSLITLILLSIRKRSDLIILHYLIMAALFVNVLLGSYELIFQESIFAGVEYNFSASRTLNKLTKRNGITRIQGTLPHPVVLGFTFTLCFPLLYVYLRKLKLRLVPITLLLSTPIIVYLTRSRGSLILILLLIGLIGLGVLMSRLTTSFRKQRIISLLILTSITIVPILFADQIFSLVSILLGEGENSLVEDSSANSRYKQFLVFLELPIETLIFGFGRVRSLLDTLDSMLSLDSFYIRTTLEAGIPGLVLLVTFQITSLSYGIKLLKKVWSQSFYRLLVGNICLTLFALFFIYNLTSTSYFSFFLFGYPALLITIDHIVSIKNNPAIT